MARGAMVPFRPCIDVAGFRVLGALAPPHTRTESGASRNQLGYFVVVFTPIVNHLRVSSRLVVSGYSTLTSGGSQQRPT
jgi:hypothetical protein